MDGIYNGNTLITIHELKPWGFLPLNKHDGHLQHTVFDLIGARGTNVNLFCTTSAKRSSSGQ